MTYTSTITSKGTITLPAAFRAQLGLKEGDKVELSLSGDSIITKPQSGWDEFLSNTNDFGKKARTMMASGKKKALLSSVDIARAAEEGRRRGY